MGRTVGGAVPHGASRGSDAVRRAGSREVVDAESGNRDAGLFVGLWVPAIHSLGTLVLAPER